MRWLVLSTAAAADARAELLGSGLGYPNESQPGIGSPPQVVYHADDRAAVGISASGWSWSSGLLVNVADLLTTAERDSLIDSPSMLADGWVL